MDNSGLIHKSNLFLEKKKPFYFVEKGWKKELIGEIFGTFILIANVTGSIASDVITNGADGSNFAA
jgi:hypothetical protein